jgi:Lysylphosphatidylglycerol synthase TM region
MGDVVQLAGDSASVIADAIERALGSLAAVVSGAAGGWLLLGILLHVLNQLARGVGWYALLRGVCDEGRRPRLRDVLFVWVAGAGAGGVLSARGGDAMRVLLISRRVPETRTSVLAGTLVAEAAGDTFVGVAVLVAAVALGAAPMVGLPGAETAGWVAVVLLSASLAFMVARRLRQAAGMPPLPGVARVRAIAAGVGKGCSSLGHPVTYGCTVLPWQTMSRVLRGGAIACFLAAFHLPAGIAAVVLVMIAQTGGRVLPLAPASAAAAVGMLTAGFGPATGATVSAGAVATFMIGMSTVLTVAGAALTFAIIAFAAGPGALHAVWRMVTPRRRAQPSEAA